MSMNDLAKEVGFKLRKIRKTLRLSNSRMAAKLGVARGTYNNNEDGKSLPGVLTFITLGRSCDISLDWLLQNKGPMYYKEKAAENEKEMKKEEPDHMAKILRNLGAETEEMLKYMDRIPLLRHEALALFHKFKEDRKEMIERVEG